MKLLTFTFTAITCGIFLFTPLAYSESEYRSIEEIMIELDAQNELIASVARRCQYDIKSSGASAWNEEDCTRLQKAQKALSNTIREMKAHPEYDKNMKVPASFVTAVREVQKTMAMMKASQQA